MGNDKVNGFGRVMIHNMPEYAKEYKYIVCTFDCGDLWFYGAYENKHKAKEVSYAISFGIVVEVCE